MCLVLAPELYSVGHRHYKQTGWPVCKGRNPERATERNSCGSWEPITWTLQWRGGGQGSELGPGQVAFTRFLKLRDQHVGRSSGARKWLFPGAERAARTSGHRDREGWRRRRRGGQSQTHRALWVAVKGLDFILGK